MEMSNPVEGTSGSARVFDGVYNETDGCADAPLRLCGSKPKQTANTGVRGLKQP